MTILDRRRLMLGLGVAGLAATGAAAAGLAGQPAQEAVQWPVSALCSVRRSILTAYERRLIERRTTRLQARRAAMAAGDPS